MAAYATVDDVQARTERVLSESDLVVCASLLEDAAVIIDSTCTKASADIKKVVSCRMALRAMSDGGGDGVPMGAVQGSMAGLGYSQSWTMSGGTVGELYLSKLEKGMLGIGNKIGSYSPVEELVPASGESA